MQIYIKSFLLIISCSFVSFAEAAESFPAQARIFGGITKASPDNLNTEMTAQGIKHFDNIQKFGAEITYSLTNFLDVGFNYTKHYQKNIEVTPTPQAYNALLDQDSVEAIARIIFLRNNFFRVDAFGGVGGSNTSFKIKTATQDGELTKREGKDWLATPFFSYGASAAVGFKKVFLVFEAGFEQNKITSLKRSGNINNNVQELNLSGSYFQIGLMFDGISATKK